MQIHGLQTRILQARILEWVAVLFSRGSSRPRDRTQVPCIAGRLCSLSHQGSHKLLNSYILTYDEHLHQNSDVVAHSHPLFMLPEHWLFHSCDFCRTFAVFWFNSSVYMVPLVTQIGKNPSAMQETRVQSGIGKTPAPRRRKLLPTPVFFPGEVHGQRSLVGYYSP